MMTTARWLGVVAVALGFGLASAVADENKEAEKLAGTWIGTTADDNGKQVPPLEAKRFRLVFTGSEFMAANGDTTIMRGTFTTNPSLKPRTIDLNSLSGRYSGKVLKGVYRIDGDTLRICFVEPGAKRPRELSSTSENVAFALVCKRQKP